MWVTDYHPDATGNVDVQEPLTKRKLKFTYGNHPDQRPMMDRDLGAMAGYAKAPTLDVEKFKAHGFQYQWGRNRIRAVIRISRLKRWIYRKR